MSYPPLPYQLPQLLEGILSQLILTFPPSQVSRKIIASSQRNNRQKDSVGVNSIFSKLTNNPHNSSITTTNNSYHGSLLHRPLFQMLHSLLPVLSEIVKISVVNHSIKVEINLIDLCHGHVYLLISKLLTDSTSRSAIEEEKYGVVGWWLLLDVVMNLMLGLSTEHHHIFTDIISN